jgi:ribulose-5-phosphate 4-epimerase/fuculose-1-phosphate aldolase
MLEVARSRVGATETEHRLRDEVAACTLILNDLEILGYSGHVSARLPGGDTFLIQSFEQSRAALAPDLLLVCDLDGRMLSGPSGQRPPAEVFLHCELYRARADVNAIAHFHHDRTTAFTLVDDVTLVPIKNHAVRWASGIPVHNDPAHVNTPARGRAVAASLGQHHAALIRAHGEIVVAEAVPALLIDCVHFVENAEAMYHASLLGRVRPLSREEIEGFEQDLNRDKHVAKLWRYYVGRARTSGRIGKDWSV